MTTNISQLVKNRQQAKRDQESADSELALIASRVAEQIGPAVIEAVTKQAKDAIAADLKEAFDALRSNDRTEEVISAIRGIPTPEMPNIDMTPMIQAIQSLMNRPEPSMPEVDLTPVLQRIDNIHIPEGEPRPSGYTLKHLRDKNGRISDTEIFLTYDQEPE